MLIIGEIISAVWRLFTKSTDIHASANIPNSRRPMKRASITLVRKFVALTTAWWVSAQISRPRNCRSKPFRSRSQSAPFSFILPPKRLLRNLYRDATQVRQLPQPTESLRPCASGTPACSARTECCRRLARQFTQKFSIQDRLPSQSENGPGRRKVRCKWFHCLAPGQDSWQWTGIVPLVGLDSNKPGFRLAGNDGRRGSRLHNPYCRSNRGLELAYGNIHYVLRLQHERRLGSLGNAIIGKRKIQHGSVRIAANHPQAAGVGLHNCSSAQRQGLGNIQLPVFLHQVAARPVDRAQNIDDARARNKH